MEIIKEFEQPCSCGREHCTAVQDVQIGSGLVKKVGEILKKNGFPKNILLVADKETIKAKKENTDWADVYSFYDEMADDVRKLNEPKTATDEVYSAMKKAGCKLTVEDIGKSQKLVDSRIKYSPYMRYRLTLLRLRGMIE